MAEPLDFAVGVGSVGPVLFVGEEHAALGELGGGSLQNGDRGDGLLVSADFGVGEGGVVVDDGVHESGFPAEGRADAMLHSQAPPAVFV